MGPTFCPLCKSTPRFFTLYLNVPPYRAGRVVWSIKTAFHGSHAADLQPIEFERLSCFTVGKACSAHWPPLIFEPTHLEATALGAMALKSGEALESRPPYLSMKEGSLFVLFCLYLLDPLNWDASDRVLGLFGKLSRRRGAWAWFHDVWTCGAKVLEC